MRLDLPTILVTTSACTAVLGMMFLLSGRSGRDFPSAPWFGLSYLLISISTLLLSMRGYAYSVVSIELANAILLTAWGFAWSAARIFERKPVTTWKIAIAPVIWIILNQFPMVQDSFVPRVIILTLFSMFFNFVVALEFYRGREEKLAARMVVVALLAANCVVVSLRIPFSLMAPAVMPGNALPAVRWIDVISMQALLHLVGLAFAVLSMARERAENSAVASLVAARDAANQANEAKSRFLARMSHELRTPLNTVFGFAQVLVQDPRLAAEQRGHAVAIEGASRHLLLMINDVLDLAMIEAGKLRLEPRPLAVDALLQGCAALVRSQSEKRGITVSQLIGPELRNQIVGDELRVRQILVNLLSNAVKFSPPGSDVLLTAGLLPSGRLCFEVHDAGPGIPPEKQPQLFQDFVRLDSSADHEFGSSGLGLAITATLAKAMGGSIGYALGPNGRGSVFRVELPQ